MKIQFLGTAAAEGFPALYCQCEACLLAWKNKGRNIRSRCQALVDDKILIDFGPDTYYHMLQHNVPLDTIHHVIITHNHSDHFYSSELEFRRKGYAAKVEEEPLYVYGAKSTFDETNRIIEAEQMPEYVQARLIKPFEMFKIMDYEIIPLAANHDPKSDPVFYLITKGDKTILYAHDTGVFPQESWDFLEKFGKHIDLVSLDCTAGILQGWRWGHLSFDAFMEVVNEMKAKNIIDENTKIFANHFSHNGKATYDQMKEVASKVGVDVAYDGMVVEF